MGKDRCILFFIILSDIILLSAVVIGDFLITKTIVPQQVNNINNIEPLLAIYVTCFIASYGLYPPILQERIVKIEDIVKRVFFTCVLALLFVFLTNALIRPYSGEISRIFILGSHAIFCFLLCIERISLRKILTRLRANNKNQKNVVLLGKEPTIYYLYKTLSNPSYGYRILGTFYDGDTEYEEIKNKRIGRIKDVYEWLSKSPNVNEIYGYFPKENQELINMVSKFCDNHLIRFYYIPAIDVFKGNIAFQEIEGIPVIARREEPLSNPRNKFIKRVFDIVFSSAVLLFLFPFIWALVAIFIKRQSPGPIFFKQERTGVDGKVFKCIKFRTMHVNDQSDTLQATKDDPRKFPFGNFMRKTNIDELPQFVNVFLGDMSVVGPRPHMLRHTEEYSRLINRFMVRHLAKPGITGLAQVTGFRGETKYIDQMEGRVQKDIEYIENWSFLLDMKIIVKTVTNMLGKEKGNAY